MLEAKASDGAAVGEVVDAEVGVEEGYPLRHLLHLRLLLPC